MRGIQKIPVTIMLQTVKDEILAVLFSCVGDFMLKKKASRLTATCCCSCKCTKKKNYRLEANKVGIQPDDVCARQQLHSHQKNINPLRTRIQKKAQRTKCSPSGVLKRCLLYTSRCV